MKARVRGTQKDAPVPVSAVRFGRDGSLSMASDVVQKECRLSIEVNGSVWLGVCCSAVALPELVVGRLFTAGVIEGTQDIDELDIDAERLLARVTLAQGLDGALLRASASAPLLETHGGTAAPSLAEECPAMPSIAWDGEWIYAIADEFERDKTAHGRTRGSHSAILADRGGILFACDDIGRHNAFDKMIGWALMNEVDLGQCLVYTSGRVPTDMVGKAVRARLPLLVSKSVATDRAIAWARRVGLTLICEARSTGFSLMCAPDAAVRYDNNRKIEVQVA